MSKISFTENFSLLFKFVIVGDCNVGKSCIMTRFTQDECNSFDENSTNTVGVEFGSKLVEVENQIIKIQIWDTAGQERFRSVTRGYYRNALGILLVFDVTNRDSFNSLATWLSEAKERASREAVVMIIANQIDREDDRDVTTEEGEAFAKKHGLKYIETSAKTGHQVEESFMKLTESIYRISKSGGDSQYSSQNTSIPLSSRSTSTSSGGCCK